MNINDKYNELSGNKFSSLNTKVKSFVPTPTDQDYLRGYVTRYFAQKVNDKNSPIYEVSTSEFAILRSSVMYNVTSLRWRITGPKEPSDYENNKIMDKGVKKGNEISINLASNDIVNLKLYLPNLTQFHKV
jgi:hypothetical protein